MDKSKKALGVLLSASLAVSGPVSVPMTAFADDNTDDGTSPAQTDEAISPASLDEEGVAPAAEEEVTTKVGTLDELKAALKAASTVEASPTVIELTADIDTAGTTTSTIPTVVKGTYVKIKSSAGSTHVIKQTVKANNASVGTLIVTGSLELENVVVDANSLARCAYVTATTGKLTLGNGAILQNGAIVNTSSFYGAGVCVAGELVMEEGSQITGCHVGESVSASSVYGLGVYVNSATAKFTMNGGSINKCVNDGSYASANVNGIGVYANAGTFTMNGGEIADCSNTTAGATVSGIGVYVMAKGTFNMTDGIIKGCKDNGDSEKAVSKASGGGVYVAAGSSASAMTTFNMTGGSIEDCSAQYGGAIYTTNYNTVNITKGKIANNNATFVGGGIAVANTTGDRLSSGTTAISITLNLGEECEITDNTAVNGGGIYAARGTVNINGAKIENNTAKTDKNIAPYECTVSANGTTSTFSNASIGSTDASVASGGGIYADGANIKMTSGSISNNKAESTYIAPDDSDETVLPAGNGGGIYVARSKSMDTQYVIEDHTIEITGGTISGNSAKGAGEQSGKGNGICVAFAASDGTADQVLIGGGTITGNSEGASLADIQVLNTLTYKELLWGNLIETTMTAHPILALSDSAVVGSIALPSATLDTSDFVYVTGALADGSSVGIIPSEDKAGTLAVAGANGYILTSSDASHLVYKGADATKTFDFDSANNLVVANVIDTKTDISDVAVEIAQATYTGQELTPDVSVTLGGVALAAGKDYSIVYSNNVDAGEDAGTITINGMGDYKGTVVKNFTIKQRSIDSAEVKIADIRSYYETGQAITPTVEVYDGDELLTASSYTISYLYNTEPGTAKVLVSGAGNYTGDKVASFTIEATPSNMKVVNDEESLLAAIADESIAGVVLENNISVTKMVEIGREFIIDGSDMTITYTSTTKIDAAIKVLEGGNLTLKNAKIVTASKTTEDIARTLYISAGGYTRVSNVVLQGMRKQNGLLVYNAGEVDFNDTKFTLASLATNTTSYKGIVYNSGTMTLGSGTQFNGLYTAYGMVYNDKGNLTLNGVVIDGCRGGSSYASGVYSVGGQVTMLDGEICSCTIAPAMNLYANAANGGTTFVMSGGSIHDNTTSANSGAIKVAGLSGNTSVMELSGGEIKNNKSTSAINSNYSGGGILVYFGELKMSGGTIEGNTASAGAGVGVYNGTFEMTGGSIKDNVATYTASTGQTYAGNALGGGVYVYGGGNYTATFNMSGGEISGNRAQLNPLSTTSAVDFKFTGQGGGVYLTGATFNMSGGSITSNAAGYDGASILDDAGQGGGVYVSNSTATNIGSVTLTGGVISGNTQSSPESDNEAQGSDLFVAKYYANSTSNTASTVSASIGGSIQIGDAHLAGQNMLTIGSALSADAKVNHLNADERTTAGSGIITVAEGVEVSSDTLNQIHYDSVLGLKLDEATGIISVGNVNLDNALGITIDDVIYTGKAIDNAILNAHVTVAEGEVIDCLNLSGLRVKTVSNNVEVGQADIVLVGDGSIVDGEITAHFNITKKPLNTEGFSVYLDGSNEADWASNSYYYTGEAYSTQKKFEQPVVTLSLDNKSTDEEEAFLKSDYYEVTDYSLPEGTGIGSITLAAKDDAEGSSYTGSVVIKFNVCGESMDNITVDTIPDVEYTGSAVYSYTIFTKSTYKVYDGDDVITPFSTYFSTNNMFSNATDAGTCTVTIAGKASGKEDHDYAYRSKTVTFKINPVDLETANVTWSKSAFEYTGEAIVAPTATVYRTGTTKYTTAAAQTEVKYYDANGEEVAADNIKEAGKYTAVLSGLEVEGTDGKQHLNYANSNTLTFYVGAESIDINDTTEDSAVKLGETLQLSSEINEESVYVAGTPEWKSSDESVATVDQTGLVTPLKAGLTTISVSAGGQTATFNISVGNNVLRECSIDWADTEHTYNGAEQTTSATVVDKNSGAKLVEGKDYVITYENNVNVGTATATITGIGDYAGTYSNTFQIEKADLSNLDAMLEYEVATYTGERLEPEVTIEGLEEGVDFEVTYSNCISKGNAYLFVKGIGNYSGRIFKTYAIEQANIVTAEVSGIAESYVYTGSKITPEIVVTWNGQTLAQKKDYGINMLNNSAIGTATVLIMGLGNFEGAQIVQFEIVAADDANDNTVGGSDSAGSGSTEGSGSNGGSDSTGSNGGSSDSSNSADTSAGSGSTSGSGSSSTTGSGVTDTSSSTTTTTPSTATTTSASTGSTESSSVDTSYVAASGSSVSISGASSSSAGSSTDSLSASSNGDVSGDDSTSSSLTVVSAVTALADAADDADASAKSSGTTTSSTDSGFNNYTSSSSSDGSQAEEGNDIAPAVAALVIFLVVAAGLGGFFLVRYLGARKAAEAAATASAAGSVGSAK